MVTTIIETQTQTVTATEVKTSSKLITPSPTLDVVTVTVTPRYDFSQGCDVSSHVSGRTKRTNPIWICIWLRDTKFAIFP